MSKVSFRARALDASKPMPVFHADDLPDLSEYAAINRAVPAMPTGMEKEEELELHLQEAITAQQASNTGSSKVLLPSIPSTSSSNISSVIPTPKVSNDVEYYDVLYPTTFKATKQLIKVEAALNLEPEIADYDIDSDDEKWLDDEQKHLEISGAQFELIMDRLEKASERQVASIKEAKALLNEDDDILVAVYDYWLAKRLRIQQPLIPRVKTEKREGTSAINPYIAFRRRAEKMQTRKNRKNDEDSYEKILKLSHDLRKAVTLLEMIKRREKTKREMINMNIEIFDKRYTTRDFNGELYRAILRDAKPSFQFVPKDQLENNHIRRHKAGRKRKHRHTTINTQQNDDKGLVSREWLLQNAEAWNKPASFPGSPFKQKRLEQTGLTNDSESWEVDGHYGFKRKRGCIYHAPIESQNTQVPGHSNDILSEHDYCMDPHQDPTRLPYLRYCRTYLRSNPDRSGNGALRCMGMVRRRMGRAGRILYDRVGTTDELDYLRTVVPSSSQASDISSSLACSSRDMEPLSQQHTGVDNWPSQPVYYFRPRSPECDDPSVDVERGNIERSNCSLSLMSQLDTNGVRVPYARLKGPKGECQVPIVVGVSDTVYKAHQHSLNQLAHRNEGVRINSGVVSDKLTVTDEEWRAVDRYKATEATAAVMNQQRLIRLTSQRTGGFVTRTPKSTLNPGRNVPSPHSNGQMYVDNRNRPLYPPSSDCGRTSNGPSRNAVSLKERTIGSVVSHQRVPKEAMSSAPSAAVMELNYQQNSSKYTGGTASLAELGSMSATKLVDKNPSKPVGSPMAVSPPTPYIAATVPEISGSNHVTSNGEIEPIGSRQQQRVQPLTRPVR